MGVGSRVRSRGRQSPSTRWNDSWRGEPVLKPRPSGPPTGLPGGGCFLRHTDGGRHPTAILTAPWATFHCSKISNLLYCTTRTCRRPKSAHFDHSLTFSGALWGLGQVGHNPNPIPHNNSKPTPVPRMKMAKQTGFGHLQAGSCFWISAENRRGALLLGGVNCP